MYDTVLIGATFFAAGYALTAPESTLIVEPRSVVGSDFAGCFLANPCSAANSEAAQTFLREVTKRGWLDQEGHPHIVPFGAMLAHCLREREIPVWLETEVLHLDDRTVTLFDRDGYKTVTAGRVIDTRPVITDGAYASLAVNLIGGSGDPRCDNTAERWCLKGAFDGEYYLHCRTLPQETAYAARRRIEAGIASGTRLPAGWQAATMATCLAWHYPQPVYRQENGVTVIPSASFGDPIAALEGGAVYAVQNIG